MDVEKMKSLVTFMYVGCDAYEQLPALHNVREDLSRFEEIFRHSEFSLYQDNKVIEVYDQTSFDFRKAIQNYIFSRSADQDILFLFFSGHGTAIGRDDFGFCMQDAAIHPEDHVILPTSVVKLSEIIETLKIKNVSLVLFVDSCYSGQISKSLEVLFTDISSEMSKNLVASSGNLFGLVSSCTDAEQVYDIGIISKALEDICDQGTDENSPYIQLGYLSETLTQRIDLHSKGDSKSRVFIPSGRIFNLPIARNVQYFEPIEPINTYSFTKPYLHLLVTMWNNGSPLSLKANQILEKTNSQSAYANHNKLSLSPWMLLADDKNGKRVLTQKGIDFINGGVAIPKIINENKNTKVCFAANGSPSIQVIEKENLFGIKEKTFIEVKPIY